MGSCIFKVVLFDVLNMKILVLIALIGLALAVPHPSHDEMESDYVTFMDTAANDDEPWLKRYKFDFHRDRRHWRFMGAVLWISTFTSIEGLIAWMPTAIGWTKLNRGSSTPTPAYFWMSMWWSNIVGMLSRLWHVWIGLSMMIYHETWREKAWCNFLKTLSKGAYVGIGFAIIASQIGGIALYYFFRQGSWRYALYLTQAYGIETTVVIEDNI